MRTPLRRYGIIAAILLALPGLLGFSTQSSFSPGDADLYNFEHVYNFNFNEVTGPVGDDSQGTDLEFFTTPVTAADGTVTDRDFVIVGSHGDGAFIFDITDPEDTQLASRVVCRQPRSDPGVAQWTDADGTLRTIMSLSNHGSPCNEAGPKFGSDGGGAALFEITDPFDPQPFAGLRMEGVHNFTFHPTELVGYSWTGALTNAIDAIPMVDLRAYANGEASAPTFKTIDVSFGPHDGEFNATGDRLYVAQQTNYAIYDTTDPFDPKLISATGVAGRTEAPGTTVNPGTYAHGVWPSADGEVMVTNNESLALGGFFASGSGVCPGEGLGFYLIGDELEAAPVGPVGYFEPPVVGRTDKRACTSHFGRVSEHTSVMSVGWYIAGSRIVDFTNPVAPREIGAAVMADTPSPFDWGSEVWSAKFYKGGYLYVGDMRRGFDVFRWAGNPDCVAPWEAGWTPDCEVGRTIADARPTNTSESGAFGALAALGDTEIAGSFTCRLAVYEQ